MRKKILVINVNWLGDVLFSVPALKALRRHNPGAHLACLVVARCREVLEQHPCLDEIIVYDEHGVHGSLFAKIRFIRGLRKKKFDEVYVLHPSLKRAAIGFLAGIPERIGYDTNRRVFLLTHPVRAPQTMLHKIDYFLRLLESCGITAEERTYEFFTDAKFDREAGRLLRETGLENGSRFVILNPGGNWPLKRWPAEHFAALADMLVERRGLSVLITGAEKDRETAGKIIALMKHPAYSLCGKTSFSALAAVMKKACCAVSGDSGPMHLAAAVGCPLAALFGPTSARWTGPSGRGKCIIIQKNIGCEVPCYKSGCADNRCMRAITPEEVFSAINRILKEEKTGDEQKNFLSVNL